MIGGRCPARPRERMIATVPRRVSSPIFVGRVAERAALTEILEAATRAQPGVVIVAGEAGIGKSRLLAEITAGAAAMGFTTVGGICVDVAAGSVAYGPFVDIVRGLHRHGFTAALPESTAVELGRLAPEAAGGTETPGGEGRQGRLFAAIRDLLAVAAASSPLLVTIEDLHWADESTLDLVTYIARSIGADRFALVATARLDTLPRRHPLVGVVAELGRLPWLERIDLERFDEAELAQQLTGILGRVPEPGAVQAVFERSDGNAFFAEELVATGDESGSLPSSLREVLAARLAALEDVTQNVVRVAAVAGRTVSHGLLEQIAGVSSPALVAALHEAVDQRVLLHVAEPTPGYSFRHALVREAAYEELLGAERITIHRAIADALESDRSLAPAGELARTGEIAYHAMAAHDLERALEASLAASTVAEAASAHAEAEVHLGRALDIWPRLPDAAARVGLDHAGLLTRTARAAAAAGHQSRAVALGLEALGRMDPSDAHRRVALQLQIFDYAWEAADIATVEQVIAEAMSLIRDERSARSARASAERGLLEWHHGRYSAALEAALHAIDVAREIGARPELALGLTVVGQAYTHQGATNQAEVAFAEAAAILDDQGDPDVRARSTWWRSWALYMHGRFEESLAMIRLGLETARRDGSDGRYGVNLLEIVLENLIELGRWPEARAVGDQILSRLNVSFEMVYTHGSLARLDTLMGRPADAERHIAEAAVLPAFGQHRVWQLEDGILLAYATGRYSEGRRDIDLEIAALPEPDHDATLWWSLLKAVGGEADRAEAARRRRRTAEVEDAVAAGRRFAALIRRSAVAAVEADGGGPMTDAVLRCAAAEESRLEGRADPPAWAAAVEARRQLGQPWELAYVRYRHAEALLASGGPSDDAAALLGAARDVAAELGAAPLRIAVEALAARARIAIDGRPRREEAARTGTVTSLTARELEVLTLVAAGHTNREIGDRLFISEKTASVHVTHAMDKLGALSRYDAAATATRLGLLEDAVDLGRA